MTPRTGHVPGHPSIAYDECGRGQALVFLHGIGGNRSNWSEQLAHFSARGWRCVAWDARGYGGSADYDGPFRFADIRADLERLLEHLDLPCAHFIGLSMGGRMLMDYAIEQPERVESLTICGAFPSFENGLDEAGRRRFIELRERPLLAGASFESLAPALVETLLSPGATPVVRERVQLSIGALRRESYLKAFRAAVEFDRSEELPRIQAPTLLLYAELDQVTPAALGAEVAARIPGARFEVLPRCGHLMNMEQPQAFNRCLEGFLMSQRRGEA